MIFEDAHWTDPTSLEAFGRTMDRIKTLPVLLIVTFRLEFDAPWVGQSHVTCAPAVVAAAKMPPAAVAANNVRRVTSSIAITPT
jgi:hypothetical protein